jgi:two-component system sensor kinase FixL
MAKKPTYRQLELKIIQLEKKALARERAQAELSVVHDALHSSVSGVIITNPDGEITYVNPAFLRIFEYGNKAEVLGKNAAELFATDEVRKFSDVQTIIDETRGETEEFGAHRKDGTTFFVEVSSSNVTDNTGKIVGRMASFIDISDKKEAQQKLEKTNEELRALVRIVSHDLQNPIIAIQGFSSRLLKKHCGEIGEKAIACLQHIKTNASRMQLLVNDLLALSKTDRVASILADISSAEIVHDVVSHFQDKLEGGHIELSMPNDFPVVYCDANKIHQVFQNLISNAVKFMQDSKKPKIEVGYKDQGDFHEFYVKDNGIGIDPQYHKKIFEVFCRLREIEDKEGTGLGLSIVERIVNSHGGKVWVKSKKGRGATFYFTLPKDPQTVKHIPKASTQAVNE